MKYLSTRDDSLSRSFNDILYQGLSRDGGLYLPQSWPKIDLLSLKNKSYEEVACEIIFPYVNENIEKLELQKILNETYANFNHEKIAPLVELEKEIENGEFSNLVNWLKKNIHEKASFFSTNEVLEQVTKSPLNAKYFKEYITNRYL